jgi:hypothetical protein
MPRRSVTTTARPYPVSRADRWRVRLLGALDAGPAAIVGTTGTVAAAVSAFAFVLGCLGLADGPHARSELGLVVLGSSGVFVGGLVAAWFLGTRSRSDRERDGGGRAGSPSTGLLLGLTLWLPLLVPPIYFVSRLTQPPTEVWLLYGFTEKRWQTSLYMVGTLGLLLALVAGAAIARAAAEAPASWRAWAALVVGPIRRSGTDEASRGSSAAYLAVKLVIGIAVAAYFFAPPWNVVSVGGIDGHMDPHLGPIQAVSHGAVPYIGAAAIQYGPGSQLIAMLYTHQVDLSIVGLREVFALYHWLGATIFIVALCLRFPLRIALPASLSAVLVFPTLQLFGFVRGGGYIGFWGWGNVLRFVGAFTLALFLSSVIARSTTRRRVAAGVGLGSFWGMLAYVSQENLVGGLIAGGTLVTLFLLTRSYPARAIGQAVAAIAAGFVFAWLPVTVYYASVGELGRFLELYTLMPRAVARGYSNTPYLGGWDGDPGNNWGKTYYTLPFALMALGVLSILRFRPFGIALRWTPERVALVSTAVAAITFHQGALLRADSSHLINTMLALPALVVVLVVYGPRVFGLQRRTFALAFMAAVVGVTLLLLPPQAYRREAVLDRLVAPVSVRRDERFASRPAKLPAGSVAAARVGAALLDQPNTTRPVSMHRFVSAMDRLRRVVGERVAYVESFPNSSPGPVYFVADLRPAPILFDPYTMMVNVKLQQDFLRAFRKDLDGLEAVVTVNLQSAEATLFAQAFPRYRTATIAYLGKPVYVLLRS